MHTEGNDTDYYKVISSCKLKQKITFDYQLTPKNLQICTYCSQQTLQKWVICFYNWLFKNRVLRWVIQAEVDVRQVPFISNQNLLLHCGFFMYSVQKNLFSRQQEDCTWTSYSYCGGPSSNVFCCLVNITLPCACLKWPDLHEPTQTCMWAKNNKLLNEYKKKQST